MFFIAVFYTGNDIASAILDWLTSFSFALMVIVIIVFDIILDLILPEEDD